MSNNSTSRRSFRDLFGQRMLCRLSGLLTLCWFTVAAQALYAQNPVISLTLKNATVREVIEAVKTQSGYSFWYRESEIDLRKRVSVEAHDQNVLKLLDGVLADQGILAKLEGRHIVLYKSDPAGRGREYQLKGRVETEAGDPIVGANVLVEGTTNGMVTNSKGEFALNVTAGARLSVSFIGYDAAQVEVGNRTHLTVVLKENNQLLDDVVVIGYGVQKKVNLTGSVAVRQMSEIENQPMTHASQALYSMPGVYINQASSKPGSDGATIRIRGVGTMSSSSPMVLVDGMEYSLNELNPGDIETISVLKDASASIYGSKAANGVIVIETKRLAGNQELVTYTGSIEVSMPDLTSYNLCNAWEKLEAERIEGVYTSANPQTQVDLTKRYNALKAQVLGVLDTYWLAKPLRTGVGHKHTLSVELGDSRKLRAMIDFSYNNVAGVMKGSERTVLSGDVNVSYRKKNFLFRNILSVSNTRSDNSPWGDFGDYARMNPYWSAVDPQTGQIARWAYDEVANPMYDATLGTLDRETYTSVTNNFYAEWQATEALKLTARLGIAVKRSDADEFYPAKHSKFATSAYESTSMQLRKGSYQLDNGKSSDISGEIYANYAKNWGRHYLYVNAGGRIAENTYSAYQHYAEGFPNSQTADITFARQYAQDKKPVGISSITREISFLGTASYSYDDRYNVDLTFRESASSLYGADNRWSSAWSAGVAWNLHNEPFLRDQDVLKQFKIRASAGLTGNQNYDTNEVLATYLYYTGATYHGQTGAYLSKMPNPALKWEQRMDYNVGADITVHRATIAFDYYNSVTENMLTDVAIPTSTGFDTVKDNLGKVRNRGIEAKLSYTLWQGKQGFFNLFGSIAYNKNIIINLSESLKAYNEKMMAQAQDKSNSTPVLIYQDGMPMNAIWAVPSLGIDPTTGQEIYVRKDGTLTYEYDAQDQVVAGISDPKYRGNFGFAAEYKGFGLSATCTFLGGGQRYNTTLVNKVENVDIHYNVDRRVLYGRWQTPGQNAMFKKLGSYTDENGKQHDEKTRATTRFVQDNNELTFSSLSLYYEFNPRLISKIRLKRLKLAFYMNNIATLSSIRIERGTTYPFARSMSFQLTGTF